MRTDSMKNFFADLLEILIKTWDGLAALGIILLFVSRGIYKCVFLGGSTTAILEAILFSVITVLMLVRLRHDAPVNAKIHWGSLASVVGFCACILIFR